MGVTVVVEDGTGNQLERLEDPTNILHRVLPQENDRSFRCLAFVDWYGDTLFNIKQMPDVRAELARVISGMADADEVAFLKRLDALAERCETDDSSHL